MDLGMRIAIAVGAGVFVLIAVAGGYWLFLRQRVTDEQDDRREPSSDDSDQEVDVPRNKRRKQKKQKKSALTYEERLKQRKAQMEEERQARQQLISDVVERANAGIAHAHDKSKRKSQARAMAVKWWQTADVVTIISNRESCAKCGTHLAKGEGCRCRNLNVFECVNVTSELVCEKCFMAGDFQPWDEILARVIECLDSRNAMLIEEVLPLSLNCPQCQASFIVKDGWEVVALNCPKCRHCVHRCSW